MAVAESGISHAFVPDPFPPAWDWPVTLWRLVVEARAAVASLNGIGKALPSPELLMRPLEYREAQRSSSLEGTYTNPEQQILFQVDPTIPSSDSERSAYREVFNYGRALRIRAETEEALPLSLRLIRQLHATLLAGVRGQDPTPGEFRKRQVQIGGPARFVPPPATYLPELLDNFEKCLHSSPPFLGFDPLVASFLFHYQFEAIHPFRDGNGRVGRLLLAISQAEWCGLSKQWLYMSAYFDANKDRYMDLLLRVSTEAAWEEWIEFCLVGTILQAKDTEVRCERLLQLYRDYRRRIEASGTNMSSRLPLLADTLFEQPVVTVAYVVNRFKVTYPTGKSDLQKLEKLNILARLENAPTYTWFAPEIMNIAYAD